MANTYADTITEVLYNSMEKIQEEPVGLLNAVNRNVSNVTQASFGTAIESLVTGDVTVTKSGSYAPQMASSAAPDVTDTKDTFALNTHLKFEVPLLPEQMLHANNTIGWDTQLQRRILKGLRACRNQVEIDLAAAMYAGASRAAGAAGTTPFASNYDVLEDLMKMLVDNGVNRYDGESSVVMNTAAGAALRKLAQLQKANEAAGTDLLRRGVLLDINGFMLRESAGISSHTKGTGASATTNAAGYAVGATVLTLASAGTGTILAGDVITFAGDTNKYVVASGDADVSNGGTITLAKPGLRVAMSAATKAITIGADYTANLAFHRDAAEIASRAPILGEDKAIMHSTITDDVSGLSWAYSIYPGEGMQMLRVQSFFGFKVWNPFMVAALLG